MQVSFVEQGTGPSVILFHGFCETHAIWRDWLSPLSKQYRIIAVDLPGFGKSPLPSGEISLDKIGDGLAAWIRKTIGGPTIVLGHSMGGYIALSILENHGDILAGIGLIHSTVYPDSPERKEVRNKTIEFVNKNGVAPFAETFVPGLFARKDDPAIPFVHEIALQTEPRTLTTYAAAMRDRQDRTAIWKTSKVPKLLVAGSKDVLISVESSRDIAKLTSHINFTEIPQAAHMGFLEAPLEAREAVSRYVASVYRTAQFS